MGPVRQVKRNRFILLVLFILCLAAILGPYLVLHLPRTCIPYVDPKFKGPGTHPRIVILSGEQCTADNPKAKCRHLGRISHYNRREYQAHHQGRYELRDNFTSYFQDAISERLAPAWAKITILKDELERMDQDGVRSANDWIFWIDTDALITNMDIELERFIDDRYSFLVTIDLNYMNAGVFMMKINDWSRNFVREIWNRRSPNIDEQATMISLLKEPSMESKRHVKYLPQCSFNSYWHVKTWHETYRPGDFAIHWAGHNYDPESFRDFQMGRFFKWL